MTREHAEARKALEPLRSQLLAVAEPDPELRDHTVARMKEQLRRLPRWSPGRVAVVALSGAFALAASAAAVTAYMGSEGRSPTTAGVSTASSLLRVEPRGNIVVTSPGDATELRLAEPANVPAGGILTTTEDSSVAIVTPSGVSIGVSRDSELELGKLADASQGSLKLLRGSVSCRVPPRDPGATFEVVTNDALVEVHGTTFTVEAGDRAKGTETCVVVSEGVVSVRRRGGAVERLTAGASSGCGANLPTSPEEQPPPPTGVGGTKSLPGRPAPAGRSSLPEESALLRAALLAEQRGEIASAQRSIDELVRRYPQSPLAPEARRVRERLRSR